MIDNALFFEYLKKIDINFYTGVPDSLLKDFCGFISQNVNYKNHVITANEGSAIALATGYHLATEKVPFVYMQNSGIGNAINPLLSLCSKEVYGIPMLIMIGWRGEPGVKDEPQHLKQGRIQEALLKALEIPYEILSSSDSKSFNEKIDRLKKITVSENSPVVLLVKKNTFKEYKYPSENYVNSRFNRESVLKTILKSIPYNSVVISTTGKTSREIYELRKELNHSHEHDFLTVGSMGHASHIALGISKFISDKTVICIDGDGSAIMHMGAFTNNGNTTSSNFKHILLNNGAHESVGGQPTMGSKINFCKIAKACNYKNVKLSNSFCKDDVDWLIESKGPSFLEVPIILGSRDNLGRPKEKPFENKVSFMNFLNS